MALKVYTLDAAVAAHVFFENPFILRLSWPALRSYCLTSLPSTTSTSFFDIHDAVLAFPTPFPAARTDWSTIGHEDTHLH